MASLPSAIGVTATQGGLTYAQRNIFTKRILKSFPSEFHHGGCIGGDDELQFIVRAIWGSCKLVMHRGDTPEKWAGCDELQDEIREPKPNLERNKDIVDETNELWAFPGEFKEQRRSGTWATIRYARDKKGSPVTIVYPDGSLERYNYEE